LVGTAVGSQNSPKISGLSEHKILQNIFSFGSTVSPSLDRPSVLYILRSSLMNMFIMNATQLQY